MMFVKVAKWPPLLRKKLSSIANTGSAMSAALTVLKTRCLIQVEDPIIVYRVALDVPSRPSRKGVLPLGTAPSKKGR